MVLFTLSGQGGVIMRKDLLEDGRVRDEFANLLADFVLLGRVFR
jgi:hypothetical protein